MSKSDKAIETVETTETVETAGVAATAAAEPAEETIKKVKIKLFKDNNKYKGDVFVAVNGEAYQIKRGVEVEVPWYIAEALNNSDLEDAKTAMKLEQLSADYAENSK